MAASLDHWNMRSHSKFYEAVLAKLLLTTAASRRDLAITHTVTEDRNLRISFESVN